MARSEVLTYGKVLTKQLNLDARINPTMVNGHILKPLPQAQPTFADLAKIERLRKIPADDDWVIQNPETDALHAYFADVGKGPLLTFEEELRLGRAVQAGLTANRSLSRANSVMDADHRQRLEEDRAKGLEARDRLIEKNLRLVISVAARYRNRSLPFEDRIEEGNLGLFRAAEKYKPNLGFRFSTYAYWWIRQGITRAIADQSRTIRLPVNFGEDLKHFDDFKQQFFAREGREPTAQKVMTELGFSRRKVEELERVSNQQLISLNSPRHDGDNSEIGDHIKDPQAADLQEDAVTNVSGEELREVVDTMCELDRQERAVLRLRFGLDDDRERSLAETGAELGVSRERVRAVEAKALAKLRQPKARSMLAQFLD